MIKTSFKLFLFLSILIYLIILIYIFKIMPDNIFLLGADSSSYVYPGISFAEEQVFNYKDGNPMHNNTPIYPIFLSIFFYIFSYHGSFFLIQITQILILIYTAYISTKLNFKFNLNDKILIFIIIIFNPNFFSNAFYAQTEILFSFFFVCSIYFFTIKI